MQRCGIDPADLRCDSCSYWPICQEASAGAWNDPVARPADWQSRVAAAQIAASQQGEPDRSIFSARQHVAALKRTFGNEPTWGMVEMAYRAGWYASEARAGIG